MRQYYLYRYTIVWKYECIWNIGEDMEWVAVGKVHTGNPVMSHALYFILQIEKVKKGNGPCISIQPKYEWEMIFFLVHITQS